MKRSPTPSRRLTHGHNKGKHRRVQETSAPSHRVSPDNFWIDRTPVPNRAFRKFVAAAGYITFVESPPDPEDYTNRFAAFAQPASLVFTPSRHPADLRDWSWLRGAAVRKGLHMHWLNQLARLSPRL
ncbi:MAG: SUMF1/EgtB/PvdO family nonheme iron enzyme [Gammaproteobacteria bacterium]|nr:SUMF1/EgtB/PvdO family nonheme iron enzyme [Gammaproteobacteria bacterium]